MGTVTCSLQELHALPDGLLQLEASHLHRYLGGPTLIHLKGRREPALFVSVLMHGNETVGWEAVRRVLSHFSTADELVLPRSLSLFIGNTAAAEQGLRHLPGQPDYNRVWPGSEHTGTPEHGMMKQVLDCMAGREIFASIDVHNNTGLNPHYACVNVLEHQALHLATLFARTVVYFVRPRGVTSMAMAALGPSVTLECGKVGQGHGVDHAADYIDASLRLSELPLHPVAVHDIDLFHTVAIVRIPKDVSFGFAGRERMLDFSADLDRLNFRELPVGTSFGRVNPGDSALPLLDVRDEGDREVMSRYFTIEQGRLLTRVPLMPSMLTLDSEVVRQDCLCYLMERYNRHLADAG